MIQSIFASGNQILFLNTFLLKGSIHIKKYTCQAQRILNKTEDTWIASNRLRNRAFPVSQKPHSAPSVTVAHPLPPRVSNILTSDIMGLPLMNYFKWSHAVAFCFSLIIFTQNHVYVLIHSCLFLNNILCKNFC